MKKFRIAVIPGDGIGKEVMPEGLRVLEAAGRKFDIQWQFDEFDWSVDYYARHGRMMPEDALDRLKQHDAIYFGAAGWPATVPDHVSLWGLLIPFRRGYDQYVNLRPIRLLRGISSPLRHTGDGIDFLVVRENNEGEYSEIGGRLYRGTPQELALQESVFTRTGVERVLRYAFDRARERKHAVVSATKSNGIIHTMPFWDEVVTEVAAGYPDVEWDAEHIDALCAQVVLDPGRFDVIVGRNLFGDILSDLTAAVAGSIGLAPSANLDPTKTYPSMFEPVHGSAPDIAGQGLANPLGAVWSAAMMLDHLGHQAASADVHRAVEQSLRDPATRTRDLGGQASTAQATEALVRLVSAP